MAMRRPRIKASANLMNVKRKKTLEQEDIKPAIPLKEEHSEEQKSTKDQKEATTTPSAKEENEFLAIDKNVSSGIVSNKKIGEKLTRNQKEATTTSIIEEENEFVAIDKNELSAIVSSQKRKEENADRKQKETRIIEEENEFVANDENDLSVIGSLQKEKGKKVTGNRKEVVTTPITEEENEFVPIDENESSALVSNSEIDARESEYVNISEGDVSFKCPPKVDASLIADDASQPYMETDVIQMDLQKSLNGFPMSPSKLARQRIRPTPIFGQRRNSFVGSSPSPHTEENSSDFTPPTQRRERHYSASQGPTAASGAYGGPHHYHAPHKFLPTIGGGRIRTESGCSAFSDSYTITSSSKRKADENSQRLSSRRDFEARFNKGVPDKSSLKMFDLIYYNPVSNPMELKPNLTSSIKNDALKIEKEESKTEANVESSEKNDAVPVPQLKLDANGEPILDHESLVIETTSEQEARKLLANSSVIFQDENTGMNGFYTRKKRTRDWPPDETIKFYRCLQTIGTDFSLMCQLFPNRTRRDLKLKFKREERCNGNLINKALLYPKIFDLEELTKQLDEDDRERKEAARKKYELKVAEAKNIKKTNSRGKSTAARALNNGDDIYRNENVLKRKFSKRAIECKSSVDVEKPLENQISLEKKPKVKRKRQAQTHSNSTQQVSNAMEHIKSENSNMDQADSIQPVTLIDAQIMEEIDNLLLDEQTTASSMANKSILPDADSTVNDTIDLVDDNSVIMEIDDSRIVDTLPSTEASRETIADDNNQTLINFDNSSAYEVSSSNLIISSEPKKEEIILPENSTETTSPIDPYDFAGRELTENDIQRLLTDLSEGVLVLVSTLDDSDSDRMIHEIYMVDKTSGDLSANPLDIPDAIVQGILSVMCADDLNN